MRRSIGRSTAAAVAALMVGGVLAAAPAGAGEVTPPSTNITVFTAQLKPESEVGGGKAGASGVAVVSIDALNGQACIELVTSGLGDLVGGHIHTGAAGVNGPVVIDFALSGTDPDSCVAVSQTLATDIELDPAGRYVNLHTAEYPSGAIRGQLGLPDQGAAQTVALVTTMSGDQETGAGDPDGTGSAYLWADRTANEVCISGSVSNIDLPSGAHIHSGAVGVDGPVVVVLDQTDLTGCHAVSDALADELALTPENFYVNVHNAAFPAGAVRGQLGTRNGAGERGTRRLVAPIRGLEEVAPGDPDGSGLAIVDANPETGEVCYELDLTGFETPTGAHIHTGVADTNGPVAIDFAVGTNGLAGCVPGNVDTVNNLLTDPAGFYVNVHTTSFSAGAGRGQLVVLPQGIFGTVRDAQAVPQPVPDTWVNVHHYGIGPDGVYVDGIPTDPNGRYRQLGLTSGSQIVSHQDAEYTGGYTIFVLPGEVEQVDIGFSDVAYIEGQITDFDGGAGLAGINVCADSLLPPLPYDEPTPPTLCADETADDVTDADGNWWIQVTPGIWGVRAGDPLGRYEADVASPQEALPGVGATAVFSPWSLYGCDPDRFTDVLADHPFCLPISWMAVTELSTGFADGTFRPTAYVSRQALAAFLWRLEGSPAPPVDAPTFTDVPADSLFFDAIRWMASEGISEGYPDGTFRPTGPLTRQAMSSFLYRLAGEPAVVLNDPGPFTDVLVDHPFRQPIQWMNDEGLSTGYPMGTEPETYQFQPANVLSRQALSAFLYRAVRQEGLIG